MCVACLILPDPYLIDLFFSQFCYDWIGIVINPF